MSLPSDAPASSSPVFPANDDLAPTIPRMPGIVPGTRFRWFIPLFTGDHQRALNWRAIALQATAIWAATRLAYIIYTYFYVTVIQGKPVSAHLLVNIWQQFDSNWYIVASLNYPVPAGTSFFPLYPLLIAIVTHVIGTSHSEFAALVVSNIGTLGAFIGMGLLAAQEGQDDNDSWLAIRILAAFPLAFFLFAGYTEGLFIAFVTFSFFFARRGNWYGAAAMAFFAGLTRPTGVILILPLVWEYGRQQGWWDLQNWRDGSWRDHFSLRILAQGVMVVGAVPLAVGLYMLYLWNRFGDPLLFLHSEVVWNHQQWSVWHALAEIFHALTTPHLYSYYRGLQVVNLGAVLIFLVLTLVIMSYIPFAYTLYMLGLLYVIITEPSLSIPNVLLPSAARYLLVSVPVFLVLSRWAKDRPWLQVLLIEGGVLLQGMLLTGFLATHWVE